MEVNPKIDSENGWLLSVLPVLGLLLLIAFTQVATALPVFYTENATITTGFKTQNGLPVISSGKKITPKAGGNLSSCSEKGTSDTLYFALSAWNFPGAFIDRLIKKWTPESPNAEDKNHIHAPLFRIFNPGILFIQPDIPETKPA
jgi:hypothetical protein